VRVLIADGLDDAWIGVAVVNDVEVAVYKVLDVIAILENDQGMSHEEAWEYFEFNVACAYVGEQTPIWVYPEEMFE
jgi:hypothetical protein